MPFDSSADAPSNSTKSPTVEARHPTRNEERLTSACIAVCVVTLLLVYRDIALAMLDGAANAGAWLHAIAAATAITILVYGSLVYLVARLGHLRRHEAERPSTEEAFGESSAVPRLCVLIPSYKEEVRVLRQTIVSAALAEHGSRRIVVLIDDPPGVSGTELAALQSTRRLVTDLDRRFAALNARICGERDAFVARTCASGQDLDGERVRLAGLCEVVARWVEQLEHECVNCHGARDHTDVFFAERVIAPSAIELSRLRYAAPRGLSLARVACP